MSTSSGSEPRPQSLDGIKNGVETFTDENGKVLVVGAKLQIEDAVDARRVVDRKNNLEKVSEYRRVCEESQLEGQAGKFTGLFEKAILYENGFFKEIKFTYFPKVVDTPYTPDDFGTNSSDFHKAACVRASIMNKMLCICGLPTNEE